MSQSKTIVKQSKYLGLGAFANRAIKSGEIISDIKGNVVHWKTLLAIGGIVQDNAIRLSEDHYLSPSGLGNYLNHSCQPNIKIVIKNRRMYIAALKNISSGHELMFDYSTIIGADDIWKMKCHCHSKICRGVVRSFDRLPDKLKTYYIQHKAVPEVILKTMQNT